MATQRGLRHRDRGVIAVGRRRTDAKPVLARADSLVGQGWFAIAPLNLVLARLWEAEGDLPRALEAVRRFEYDDPDRRDLLWQPACARRAGWPRSPGTETLRCERTPTT